MFRRFSRMRRNWRISSWRSMLNSTTGPKFVTVKRGRTVLSWILMGNRSLAIHAELNRKSAFDNWCLVVLSYLTMENFGLINKPTNILSTTTKISRDYINSFNPAVAFQHLLLMLWYFNAYQTPERENWSNIRVFSRHPIDRVPKRNILLTLSILKQAISYFRRSQIRPTKSHTPDGRQNVSLKVPSEEAARHAIIDSREFLAHV